VRMEPEAAPGLGELHHLDGAGSDIQPERRLPLPQPEQPHGRLPRDRAAPRRMRWRLYPRMNGDRRTFASAWLLYMGAAKKSAFSVFSPPCIRPFAFHSRLWNATGFPALSLAGTPRISRQFSTFTRASSKSCDSGGPSRGPPPIDPYSGDADAAGGRDSDRNGPAGGRLSDRVGRCGSGGAEIGEDRRRGDRHRDARREWNVAAGVGARPHPDRARAVHEMVVHAGAVDIGADALVVPDRELPALVQPGGNRLRLPLERGRLQIGHEEGNGNGRENPDDGHDDQELDKLEATLASRLPRPPSCHDCHLSLSAGEPAIQEVSKKGAKDFHAPRGARTAVSLQPFHYLLLSFLLPARALASTVTRTVHLGDVSVVTRPV